MQGVLSGEVGPEAGEGLLPPEVVAELSDASIEAQGRYFVAGDLRAAAGDGAEALDQVDAPTLRAAGLETSRHARDYEEGLAADRVQLDPIQAEFPDAFEVVAVRSMLDDQELGLGELDLEVSQAFTPRSVRGTPIADAPAPEPVTLSLGEYVDDRVRVLGDMIDSAAVIEGALEGASDETELARIQGVVAAVLDGAARGDLTRGYLDQVATAAPTPVSREPSGWSSWIDRFTFGESFETVTDTDATQGDDGRLTSIAHRTRRGRETDEEQAVLQSDIGWDEASGFSAAATGRRDREWEDLEGTTHRSERGAAASWDAEAGLALSADDRRETDLEFEGQTVATSLARALSYEEGTARGTLSSSREVAEGDERHATTHGAEAWYGEAGYGGRVSGEEVVADEVSSTTRSASLGYDDEAGFSAAAERSRTLGDPDEDHITTTWGASYGEGVARARGAEQTAYDQTDGTRVTTDRHAGASWSEEGLGVDVGSGRQTERTHDGETHATDASWSAAYGPDGPAGAVSRAETVSDDVSSRTRQASFGYDPETGLAIDARTSQTLSAVEDHELTRSRYASFADGTATFGNETGASWVDDDDVARTTQRSQSLAVSEDSVNLALAREASERQGDDTLTTSSSGSAGFNEHGLMGSVGAQEVRETDVGSQSRSADMSWDGEQGFRSSVQSEEVLSAVDGHEMTSTRSAEYSGGNATFSRGEGATWEGDDGQQHASSHNTSLSVGEDGVEVGRTMERRLTQEDGTSTATTGGGSVNLADRSGTINAGRVNRDADGNVTSSVSGSATAQVGDRGVERASVSLGGSRGNQNVAVNGDYQFVLDEPVEVDGQWIVTYTRSLAAGASGGTRRGRVGVNAGVRGGQTESGRRVFASAAEARRFYEEGDLGEIGVPGSADEAFALEAGEVRGTTDDISGQLGATGNYAGVTAGANVEAGSTNASTLEREQSGAVVLTVAETDRLGASGTLGAPGISMGLGGSSSETGAMRLRFHDTPAGRSAYNYFQEHARLPDDESGWELVSTTQAETSGRTQNVSFFGMEYGGSQEVSHETTWAGDDRIDRSTGTDSTSLRIPFLGSHRHSHGMELASINGEDRRYVQTSVIDDTHAADANRGLSNATGTYRNANVEGESSGQWSVTSTFTEEQMDAFAAHVTSGNYIARAGMIYNNAGENLQRALRDAGNDEDARRRALADFVAGGGHNALEHIRSAVGPGEQFLELEDDPYFTGMRGRMALDARLEELESRLAEGATDASLVGDIRSTLAEQMERHAVIEDTSNYPELGRQLRARELSRSERDIERLQAMRNRASTERATALEAGQGEESPALCVEGGQSEAAPEMSASQRALLNMERRALELEERLEEVKGPMNEAHRAVRKSRWVHDGAYAFHKSAREDLGHDGWIFSGPEVSAYERADGHFDRGRRALNNAQNREQRYIRSNPSTVVEHTLTLQSLERAVSAYERAQEAFEAAEREYRAIYNRHRDDYHKFWTGYDRRMPDGV